MIELTDVAQSTLSTAGSPCSSLYAAQIVVLCKAAMKADSRLQVHERI